MSEMTAKILEETLEKTVLVRLRGGRKLRGKVKGFDNTSICCWRKQRI